MEVESPTLKTFNNYSIIMTNNSERKRILWALCFCLLLIFELTLVNFMLFLNILKILKISVWTFWRKNCISLLFFSWKRVKAFRAAEWKHPRLVKPSLNSDLNFICKTPGTTLLETIVSYKPIPNLSQENRKTLFPALLGTSTVARQIKRIK